MLLYAVARKGKEEVEYYVPKGDLVGWTSDLDACWARERQSWAEIVKWELARQGHYDTFLWVFWRELGSAK